MVTPRSWWSQRLPWLVFAAVLALPAVARPRFESLVEDAREAAVPVAAARNMRPQAQDVLILFDDVIERERLRSAIGGRPGQEAFDRATYERQLATRRELLRALKSDVLLQAADPDVAVVADFENLPIVHARIASPRALENLRRHSRIRSIDAIVGVRTALAQSLSVVGQPQAQAAGRTGAGTTVAVLDTGVDYARAAFGQCASPGGDCKVAHAQDFATEDHALDANGHGTNVAGIVLGVAPGARIAALDVFESNGLAYSNAIIAAINWCIANKAALNIVAINMSLGGGRHYAPLAPTDAWGTAIAQAVSAGITVVAASGNNGYTNSMSSPGAYSNVVSVGAVYDSNMGPMGWSGCSDASTAAGKVTCFSNSASFLTMLAPGALINAAGITQGGTSQATPHVAGAVAVLKAAYPGDTVAQTIDRLKLGPRLTDPRNGISVPSLSLTASTGVAPSSYRLTLTKSGAGAGSVTGNVGGFACSASCSADIASGTAITLTALHGPGAMFNGWSGACAGSGATCTVSMTAARNVTASFGLRSAEDLVVTAALPAGWMQTAGAQAGWSASTGSTYVGSHALKAAGVGHGQAASTSISGRFAAGAVRFARRVSSQAGGDVLQFLVDGQEQGRWSGEVPWGMVSYPLTAGEHVLTWTYLKDAAGSAGGDTAWIDSVHLPWAIANPRAARHDLDGDGRADLVWRHAASGQNQVWLMGGPIRQDGSGPSTGVSDTSWRVLATDDLDGDGRAEVLWRHAISGRNIAWRMNGVSAIASTDLPTITDPLWTFAGSGDFDGDGKADLLWRHASSGRNVIWRMDGTTRQASTETTANADVRWRVAGVADFDGDGKADILWRHAATGRNFLWRMDGATRVSSTELPAVADLRWAVTGVDDFDGDGRADILWRHGATGQNLLWRMSGASRLASHSLTTVADLGWQVAGVADFDGDGRPDILWRHASLGRNAVWLMDGATRRAAHDLESVTDVRWQVVSP